MMINDRSVMIKGMRITLKKPKRKESNINSEDHNSNEHKNEKKKFNKGNKTASRVFQSSFRNIL